jgi:hypothetical protein
MSAVVDRVPPRRFSVTARQIEELVLMTPPEVAAKFRVKYETVLQACKDGDVKCALRKPRRGKVGYVIDGADALRKWGPQ